MAFDIRLNPHQRHRLAQMLDIAVAHPFEVVQTTLVGVQVGEQRLIHGGIFALDVDGRKGKADIAHIFPRQTVSHRTVGKQPEKTVFFIGFEPYKKVFVQQHAFIFDFEHGVSRADDFVFIGGVQRNRQHDVPPDVH